MFGCVGGSSTATRCNTGLTGMTVYSVEGWYMWQLWLENSFGVIMTGGVERSTCPSLAVHLGRMKSVCRVVVGCTESDGWKISSCEPNGCKFTEWRCLLLEWGCLPTLRSLSPIGSWSL